MEKTIIRTNCLLTALHKPEALLEGTQGKATSSYKKFEGQQAI
jgi:hypothetical protein